VSCDVASEDVSNPDRQTDSVLRTHPLEPFSTARSAAARACVIISSPRAQGFSCRRLHGAHRWRRHLLLDQQQRHRESHGRAGIPPGRDATGVKVRNVTATRPSPRLRRCSGSLGNPERDRASGTSGPSTPVSRPRPSGALACFGLPSTTPGLWPGTTRRPVGLTDVYERPGRPPLRRVPVRCDGHVRGLVGLGKPGCEAGPPAAPIGVRLTTASLSGPHWGRGRFVAMACENQR